MWPLGQIEANSSSIDDERNIYLIPDMFQTRNHIEAEPIVWEPELVKRFWDYHSRFQETYFTTQFGKQIIQAINRFLPRGGRTLDYACGTGALTGILLNRGFSVGSFDLSQDSLDIVQGKFCSAPGFLGVISSSEIKQVHAGFDAVLLVEIVEHVDNEALDAVFQDVRRVLRPGGIVVITTPNDENLSTETVYCPCCNKTFNRWQHVRSWSSETLSKLFKDQSLNIVNIFATNFALSRDDGLLFYLSRRAIAYLLGRKPPHLVGIARLPSK